MSAHAAIRQKQRNVSQEDIAEALISGERNQGQKSQVIRDEKTHVVMGQDGTIITVSDNKRNTKFDLLNKTKQRIKVLQNKANKGNDAAMCELAELYLDGSLGYRDVQAAEALLNKAIKKRNSHAMCLMANLYRDGDLGTPSESMYYHWLEKAAYRKNRFALAVCAQKYIHICLGIENHEALTLDQFNQYKTKALKFLKEAGNKNATRALWQQAKLYEEGWLVKKDLKLALTIYTRAARIGSPASLDSLKCLVKSRKLSSASFEQILESASNHVAKTSSDMAVELGYQQAFGILGQTPERGLYLLEKAAKKNHVEAFYFLIKCYREGIGGIMDSERANYWTWRLKDVLEKSAKQGNIESRWALGKLFISPEMAIEDTAIAEEHFEIAASNPHTQYIYKFGKYYLTKKNATAQERQKGRQLLRAAMQQWQKMTESGDQASHWRLVKIYLSDELACKDIQKVIHHLDVLITKQDPKAIVLKIRLLLTEHISFTTSIIELYQQLRETKNDNYIIKAIAIISDNTQDPLDPKLSDLITSDLLRIGEQKLEHIYVYDSAHISHKCAHLLATVCLSGKFIPVNIRLATNWLFYACSRGNKEAMQAFNRLLNLDGINADDGHTIVDALQEIAKISTVRYPYRIGRVLGDIFYEGKLISQDVDAAIYWHKQAAEVGNTRAMVSLAQLLMANNQYEESVSWLLAAAEYQEQKAIQQLRLLMPISTKLKNAVDRCLNNISPPPRPDVPHTARPDFSKPRPSFPTFTSPYEPKMKASGPVEKRLSLATQRLMAATGNSSINHETFENYVKSVSHIDNLNVGKTGRTALATLCARQQLRPDIEIARIKILLKHGASWRAQDRQGQTAEDTLKKHHPELVNKLVLK